ncbi:ferrous iron transport protein A [Bacilli bacterium PM5-3]|nr:ferrous iron transport protein A [Bacilli bacterium PM5-3]MDH6603479.1 ferrous iron transport protein A [Bacilli bacterium PM5-9]
MKLSDLKRGESAKIKKINLDFESTHRLISLGFSYGNTIIFERSAPLGDPQQYYVAGNYIAIRKEDSAKIEVEKI